jgi:hypothetical protein
MRRRLVGLVAVASSLVLLLPGAAQASSVMTPNVVMAFNDGNSLDVQLRFTCSRPATAFGGHAFITTPLEVTVSDGLAIGHSTVEFDGARCDGSPVPVSLVVNTDPGSPPFSSGFLAATITVHWEIPWIGPPPPGCVRIGCFNTVDETGTLSVTTFIVPRGTQPPDVPPPF